MPHHLDTVMAAASVCYALRMREVSGRHVARQTCGQTAHEPRRRPSAWPDDAPVFWKDAMRTGLQPVSFVLQGDPLNRAAADAAPAKPTTVPPVAPPLPAGKWADIASETARQGCLTSALRAMTRLRQRVESTFMARSCLPTRRFQCQARACTPLMAVRRVCRAASDGPSADSVGPSACGFGSCGAARSGCASSC